MSRYVNFQFAIKTLDNVQLVETMTCHFCDVTSLKCIKILAKIIIYSFFFAKILDNSVSIHRNAIYDKIPTNVQKVVRNRTHFNAS